MLFGHDIKDRISIHKDLLGSPPLLGCCGEIVPSYLPGLKKKRSLGAGDCVKALVVCRLREIGLEIFDPFIGGLKCFDDVVGSRDAVGEKKGRTQDQEKDDALCCA